MAIDIGALFGQAKDAAQQGMQDILQTAGNSGLGYLEQQGAGILQGWANGSQKKAQEATAEILKRPSAADSFGAYLSNTMSSPILKEYGPMLLAGLAVVIIVAKKF